MRRIEFDTIMKIIGAKIDKTQTFAGIEYYVWKDLIMFYDRNMEGAYARVVGKLPLEAMKELSKQNSDNMYGITFVGEEFSNNPEDCAYDEIYDKELEEIKKNNKKVQELISNKNEALNRLKLRDDKDKYVPRCNIYLKEGLLLLLIEMQKYVTKHNDDGYHEMDYDLFYKVVLSQLLYQAQPSLNLDYWKENADVFDIQAYEESLERVKESETDKKFREALDQFDKLVNPFINNKLDCSLSEVLPDVYVSVGSAEDDDFISSHVTVVPKDNTYNCLTIHRDEDEYYNEISYCETDEEEKQYYTKVKHSFYYEEHLEMKLFTNEGYGTIDYNITDNIIRYNGEIKNDEEIPDLIELITCELEHANTIAVDINNKMIGKGLKSR